MKFSVAASLLALAATVSAHTQVYSVWINGQDQGDGRDRYIRSPGTNNPVKDINSQAIKYVNGTHFSTGRYLTFGFFRCNVKDRQVPNWVNARAGDEISESSFSQGCQEAP